MNEETLSTDEINVFVQSLHGGVFADQVRSLFSLVCLNFGSVVVSEIHASRDASHCLFEIAWQCGFSSAAWLFYGYYEDLSRALLLYQ